VYQIKKLRVMLVSITAIVVFVISAMNYFATAEAFNEHVRKQELKELVYTTTQYQISYKCYRESCQGNMPKLLYIEYVKMLSRIEELKKK